MVESTNNTAANEEPGDPEEPEQKMIDTMTTKAPVEVVSVKPVKYEVVSGTIGSLPQEEQDALNARERMFDATVPPEMHVEEKKEPRKKNKPVLTSSSINVE